MLQLPKKPRQLMLHHISASIFVIILSLSAALGLWVQFETSQNQLRSNLLEQADQRAIQLSDAVSEQFVLLLRNADFALQDLRDAWLVDLEKFKLVTRSLQDRFPGQALVHIRVIGADGFIIHSNRDIGADLYAGNHKYFKSHSEAMKDSLHIGKPVYARVSGQWSIPVSYPVIRDGEFAGVIVIGLSPEYLSAQLAKVNISEHDIIVFLDQDGTFLARNMELDKALGRTVNPARPFLAKDAPVNGVFHAPATLDAIPRIFGWTKMQHYDLFNVVGLDLNYLLGFP